MNKESFLNKRKKSFGHAFKGVAIFVSETTHAKVHLLAAVLVVVFAYFLKVNKSEWLFLILCIALVFTTEAINSAIEYAVDLASPKYNVLAKKAKDVAAGAVLIASIFSAIMAALIFGPYLVELIN